MVMKDLWWRFHWRRFIILQWKQYCCPECYQSKVPHFIYVFVANHLKGTPIIYVNYNYRLGPLGFPQGQEADNRGQLNLGVRDVLTALEWVQQNIGLFGGDKTKARTSLYVDSL